MQSGNSQRIPSRRRIILDDFLTIATLKFPKELFQPPFKMHANIINAQRLYSNGEDLESGALKKLLQRLFCPESKVMRRCVYDRVKQGRPAPEPGYREAKLTSLLQDLV